MHAGADREHATLRLAPVQAAGYHRLRIDTGAYTGIEATLAIAPALLQRGRRTAGARTPAPGAPVGQLRATLRLAAQRRARGPRGRAGRLHRSGRARTQPGPARRASMPLALSRARRCSQLQTRRYSPYSPSSPAVPRRWIDPAALLGPAAARQAIADCGLADTYAQLETATLIDWPASATARLAVLRTLHRRMLAGRRGR